MAQPTWVLVDSGRHYRALDRRNGRRPRNAAAAALLFAAVLSTPFLFAAILLVGGR